MPISSEIKRAFAANTTILTATVRTARWLRREYALEQRRAGRRAWVTPPIEDWDTWLHTQWQAVSLSEANAPLLLTSLQERRVWTRMLKEDAQTLVSPAGMATLAEDAYALLSSYEAHAERYHEWGKNDAERFRHWAADFDRDCAQRNWMPRAHLEHKIATVLAKGRLPEEMLLVGFERATPAQKRLLDALAEMGVKVAFGATAASSARKEYVATPGQQHEIVVCARWVRERLKENPEARIAVLAPDLSAIRNELERTFRRVLMPQAQDIFTAQPMPFEFSLGLPLGNVPVIRAALMLLRWLHGPLEDEEVRWLLLSGFLLQEEAEFMSLAKLDARRRDSGALSLEISLSDFLKFPSAEDRAVMTRLTAMHKVAAANRIEEEERLPGRWTDIAQLLLREGGWPGAAKRNTVHFQALRRWERALDEVALLDFNGRGMKYQEFLEALEGYAQEVIFAPESVGAPVQIMGAMEAAGQQFDAVWFLSVDDQSWPLRGRSHPLLPNDVQRRRSMPYADPEKDLAFGRAVTERVATSASWVVFSYAKRNKDGEMRPSPLLPQDAAWLERDEPLIDEEGSALEEVEESSEVAAWPPDVVAGGYAVLKGQAACPFQAFAKERLCARPLNRNEWGLSESERGILLHKTLEKIWSPNDGALHSLEDLQAAIREGQLDEILKRAIAKTFAAREQVANEWERAYLTSEKQRLQLRLKAWMEQEAERAPFEVIACEERLDNVSVGELKLRLRVDRVDELADAGRVLIDYKSSKVSAKDWETPRPNEPQLPLYAVFGGIENVRGVLFGQIRADGTAWKGSTAGEDVPVLANNGGNKKLAKVSYDAQRRDAWEVELLRLADEFLRGQAIVDPKAGKETCKYCGLQGLCRVIEARNLLEESEREDDSGEDSDE